MHGLTRYVVNYLLLFFDYRDLLSQLFANEGGDADREGAPPSLRSLKDEDMEAGGGGGGGDNVDGKHPKEAFYGEGLPQYAALGRIIAWKLQVLTSNLEGKARQYRNPAQGQVFLVNNIQYMARKVRWRSRFFL